MNDKLLQSPLFDEIRTYISQANENDQILLFVPYIKSKILDKLLKDVLNPVTVITTWKTEDLVSGSSDIKLYQWCKNNGNFLYINKKIHLKVYSVNLNSAIVASGNISHNGLEGGKYEAGVFVEKLTSQNRLFLEKIKKEAHLVDDDTYQQYLENYEECKKKAVTQEPFPQPEIKSSEDYFLQSALPMTDSMEQVVQGYLKIQSELPPSTDPVIADCIFHDIANYNIPDESSEDVIREALTEQFLSHPFTQTIMGEIDNSERKHFGKITQWIHEHCTEVPLPKPWEFKTNTNILMNWLVESGDYREFQYGSHTKSIERINHENNRQSKNPDNYENKVLEILNGPGMTIEQIKEKYRSLPSQHTLHLEPSDANEEENKSKFIWHYKDEIDIEIAKRFSLSEEEIGERNSRGKLYKKIVDIIINLHENKLIKFWYYKKHRIRGTNSDGVWRLTDKGKEESKQRGIVIDNQTINSQNPISEFNIGEFYHHDEIWKPLDLGWSGGIRNSVKNKLVILFWNAPAENIQKEKDDEFGRVNIYEDSFDEKTGYYRYIGEGKEGNQTLSRGNKSIAEAKNNGRTIHLFHQHERNGKHEYLGEVELIGKPETQTHQDINKNDRKEYVFFLKPVKI